MYIFLQKQYILCYIYHVRFQIAYIATYASKMIWCFRFQLFGLASFATKKITSPGNCSLDAWPAFHSGLQQSARPHIRVSQGVEKWSNSQAVI